MLRLKWNLDSDVAIHNYEDRSSNEIVPADQLFLAHFGNTQHSRGDGSQR